MSHEGFTNTDYQLCPVVTGWSDGFACFRNSAVDDTRHERPCSAQRSPHG